MAAAKVETPLHLNHIFGLKGDVKSNVWFYDELEVLYPAGHRIVCYKTDSDVKKQKFVQGDTKNGNSEITAMAMHGTNSKTHQYLAVAERGDRAIINVYDLDQLFGNRRAEQGKQKKYRLHCNEVASREYVSLSFSPDGKNLLAQGGDPDWTLVNFLFKKQKVQNFAQISDQGGARIHQVSYHPTENKTLCVSGDGILRFLRLEQNEFRTIPFSIGKREWQNYLCHAWVDDRVLVGTDSGDILVFENADYRGVLKSSPSNGKSIDCIAPFAKGFVCGCDEGVLYIFERDDKDIYKENKSFQIADNYVKILNLAISPSEDNLVCTLANNQAWLLNLSNTDILKPEEMHFEPLSVAFHNGQITGLDVCLRKPLVVTCCTDKTIRVWNYKDHSLEVYKAFKEQPYSVAMHPSGLYLLAGFAESLRFMNILMDDLRPFYEFAVKRCREISFSNGGHRFAVANKEVIFVYDTWTCELVCTFQLHKARVNSLRWSQDDSHLVSCGIDGRMFLWSLRLKKQVRQFEDPGVNLRSAAVMHDIGGDNAIGSSHQIILAGNDNKLRVVGTSAHVDMQSAGLLLTELALPSGPQQKILCCGTETGVVRVFDLPLGNAPPHDYECHSAPVTHISMAPDDSHVFSAGADGCLAIFEIQWQTVRRQAMLPPSNKILMTRADMDHKLATIRDLRNHVRSLRNENTAELTKKERQFNEKEKEVRDKYTQELEADKDRFAALEEKKAAMEQQYIATLEQLEHKHTTKIKELEQHFQEKVQVEVDRIRQLEGQLTAVRAQWARETTSLEEQHIQAMTELQEDQNREYNRQQNIRAEQEERVRNITSEFEDLKQLMEQDADAEIDELKRHYDERLTEERKQKLELKEDNVLFRKEFEERRQQIELTMESIKKKSADQQAKTQKIESLRRDQAVQQHELTERDRTIRDKIQRIYDLKKKNQELEKFRFVLKYKIKELKRQIQPSLDEISNMKKQKTQMQEERDKKQSKSAELGRDVKELTLKLRGMEREIRSQEESRREKARVFRRVRTDMLEAYQQIDNPKDLKEAMKALYQKYVTEELSVIATTQSTKDEHAMYKRQRTYLERSVDALRHKFEKDQKVQQKDNQRIMQENMVLVKEINQLRREIQLIKQLQESKKQESKAKLGRLRTPAQVWRNEDEPPSSARGAGGPRTRKERQKRRKELESVQRRIDEQVETIQALQNQLNVLQGSSGSL